MWGSRGWRSLAAHGRYARQASVEASQSSGGVELAQVGLKGSPTVVAQVFGPRPKAVKALRIEGETPEAIAEAFVEQLATFALRRVMTIDDADEIRAIAMGAKKDDYRLRNLMEALVLSDLFSKR